MTEIGFPGAADNVAVTVSFEQDGRFHFDVEIQVPLVGKIVRYAGYLEPH